MTNEEFIKSITIEGEEWKDVTGYEGYYMVSSFGRVVSFQVKPRLLNPYIDKYGYYNVNIYKDGKPKTCRVHRILMASFIENKYNLPCIDHIDGNKSNNNIKNLRWCTNKENQNNPITRSRMSKSMKKRISEGFIYKKPVIGININKPNLTIIFNTMYHSEFFGFCSPSITKCCKGRLHKHKGFRWYYLSDYKNLINKSKNSSSTDHD